MKLLHAFEGRLSTDTKAGHCKKAEDAVFVGLCLCHRDPELQHLVWDPSNKKLHASHMQAKRKDGLRRIRISLWLAYLRMPLQKQEWKQSSKAAQA